MHKLHKKIILRGTLKLLTGLHIGDSKESVEIGGVDLPVVRRKDNNQPYIPGSSLKGKLRSLVEVAMGANADTEFRDYTDKSLLIAQLFGWFGPKGKPEQGNPSRLLVRDASLTEEWAKKLYDSDFTDMPYTEVKFENSIDRVRGVAQHPRQIERVPAGAEFDVEFVINVMEAEKDRETLFLELLDAGINLLHHDYLGGHGSRGYGQVEIKLDKPVENRAADYFLAKNQT